MFRVAGHPSPLNFSNAWFDAYNKNYNIAAGSTMNLISQRLLQILPSGYTIKLDCTTIFMELACSQNLIISRESDRKTLYLPLENLKFWLVTIIKYSSYSLALTQINDIALVQTYRLSNGKKRLDRSA